MKPQPHQRPPRQRPQRKLVERDETTKVGADEEYRLPLDVRDRAYQLRGTNKFTIAELAQHLNVSLDDLNHDFDLHKRELDSMDD